MKRFTRTVALAAAVLGAGYGAVPASAQSPLPLWNCRASALSATVTGADRVEPLVANGNANTAAGANPDYALCATANVGQTNLTATLSLPADVISARTANATTTITPEVAIPPDQKVSSSASVEDLKLPLGSGSVVLGVGAANSSATGSCVAGVPQLDATSQLTNVTLGGTPISLDEVLTQLTDALAPLGPIVEIKVNEQIRDATSLTVNALHVKVLQAAGDSPVLDVVLAQSRVVAPAGVCDRSKFGPGTGTNTGGGGVAGTSTIRPCPPGSVLDAPSGYCVIRDKGPGGRDIIIGLPYQGPSGGRVVALTDARRLYPRSPCVKGPGPQYVVVGTNANNRITGTNRADRILGLGGNDSLAGGRGNDCLDGGSGRDNLSGSIGADRVYGWSGNDALNGGSSNDRLSGGSGNDTINAGYGADRVYGGAGVDFINVATRGRKARVSCGSGRDKVRFNSDEARHVRRDCEVRYQFADRPRA